MTMMFFVKSDIPKKFASADQQQIKGLNVETPVCVCFPAPDWISDYEYAGLRPGIEDASPSYAYFSLNLSIYIQSIIPDDWNEKWFFMYGRVHPYALTWQLVPDDASDPSAVSQDYTIPALIVRDQGFQP
jgi:hypothetical protein